MKSHVLCCKSSWSQFLFTDAAFGPGSLAFPLVRGEVFRNRPVTKQPPFAVRNSRMGPVARPGHVGKTTPANSGKMESLAGAVAPALRRAFD